MESILKYIFKENAFFLKKRVMHMEIATNFEPVNLW